MSFDLFVICDADGNYFYQDYSFTAVKRNAVISRSRKSAEAKIRQVVRNAKAQAERAPLSSYGSIVERWEQAHVVELEAKQLE